MRRIGALITLSGLLAVALLLPIDAIFEHNDSRDHLSKCPFSGLIYGFICISVFYIVLLEYILYRFNVLESESNDSLEIYTHYSPRAPPIAFC